jgi:hypothetical protein
MLKLKDKKMFLTLINLILFIFATDLLLELLSSQSIGYKSIILMPNVFVNRVEHTIEFLLHIKTQIMYCLVEDIAWSISSYV